MRYVLLRYSWKRMFLRSCLAVSLQILRVFRPCYSFLLLRYTLVLSIHEAVVMAVLNLRVCSASPEHPYYPVLIVHTAFCEHLWNIEGHQTGNYCRWYVGNTEVCSIIVPPHRSRTSLPEINISVCKPASLHQNRSGQATYDNASGPNSINLPSNVEGGTYTAGNGSLAGSVTHSLGHSPTSKKSWNVKKVPMGKATMATVNSTSVFTTERLCFADNLRRPGHRVKSHRVGKGGPLSAVYTVLVFTTSPELGQNGFVAVDSAHKLLTTRTRYSLIPIPFPGGRGWGWRLEPSAFQVSPAS